MKKKLLLIVLIITLFTTTLVGCKKDTFTYEKYFKNFNSISAVKSIETVFTLPKNIFVVSYDDEDDIYVISETIAIDKETNITLFGFASSTQILIEPRYYSVKNIVGDYAIVTKVVAAGDKTANKIGLVKFRGEYAGREYGFAYGAIGGVGQYTFLNDKYLAVMGDITNVSNVANPTFEYATIYDYRSAQGKELLEYCMVKNVSNSTNFLLKDDNLATYAPNVVRYHKFTDINANGILNVMYTYTPYDSDDGFLPSNVSCEVYYTGNNWFISTSIYSSSTKYDGYEMTNFVKETETTYYMTVRSYKYNMSLKKGYKVEDRVVLVANEYNDDNMRDIVDTYNQNNEQFTDIDGIRGQYFQPIVPVSSIIKSGYSLVYYYYYYKVGGEMQWGKTFCIYDSNCERIDLEGLIMPLLFVDGIGLQNADPTFDIPARSAAFSKMDGSEVILDKMSDKIGYDAAVYHDGVILSYKVDITTLTSMMGAYAADGTPVLPYKYFELTPYFGGYCTASQIEVVDKDKIRRLFYSVDKKGKETPLKDVYVLKNGVYVTRKDNKYGLYSNEGKELIPTNCVSVSVIENFLIGDAYMTTTVVVATADNGIIYKLTY